MPETKKQSVRCFTRADVVKFYEEHWGKRQDPRCTFEKVAFLPDFTPPLWHLSYMATYDVGTSTERIRFHDLLVAQQTQIDGTPYLNVVCPLPMSEGCLSVEEDGYQEMRKEFQKNPEAGCTVLPHLELDVEHLPKSTTRFTKALAAYVAHPMGDVTGLQLYNLREMAKSLKMNYERIDGLLSILDTREEKE